MAFAAFALLSLGCVDIEYHPNLGGPLGVALAESVRYWFGYQSYALAILAGWFAMRMWGGAGWWTLACDALGGFAVIIALSSAVGLLEAPGFDAGGEAGATVAGLQRTG